MILLRIVGIEFIAIGAFALARLIAQIAAGGSGRIVSL